MESPCIKVCKLKSGVCIGCGRTQEQLRMWTAYTDEQRQSIMESLDGTTEAKAKDTESYNQTR